MCILHGPYRRQRHMCIRESYCRLRKLRISVKSLENILSTSFDKSSFVVRNITISDVIDDVENNVL